MVRGEAVDGQFGERRAGKRGRPRIEVDDQCGARRCGQPEGGDAMKDRVRTEESPNEHGGRSYALAPSTGTP